MVSMELKSNIHECMGRGGSDAGRFVRTCVYDNEKMKQGREEQQGAFACAVKDARIEWNL